MRELALYNSLPTRILLHSYLLRTAFHRLGVNHGVFDHIIHLVVDMTTIKNDGELSIDNKRPNTRDRALQHWVYPYSITQILLVMDQDSLNSSLLLS